MSLRNRVLAIFALLVLGSALQRVEAAYGVCSAAVSAHHVGPGFSIVRCMAWDALSGEDQ